MALIVQKRKPFPWAFFWFFAGIGLGFIARTPCSADDSALEERISETEIELEVLEELPVFARPRLDSNPFTHLQKGTLVPTSTELRGSFRRVWVRRSDGEKEGFVPLRLIRKSVLKKSSQDSVGWRYAAKSAYGAALIGSYLRQGEGHFSLSDGSEYSTSAFQSMTGFVALFADIPLNSIWGLRPYLNYRQTSFTGHARQTNSLSPSPSNPAVSRKQTLFSIGLSFKINFREFSPFWWGGGGELGKGQSLELSLDGQLMPSTSQDLPMFVIGYGAMGASWGFGRHFFFVPEVKIGAIGTTSPFSTMAEAWLAFSYQP